MKYGKLMGYTVEETGIKIQYETGNCYVQQIADGILRFTDLPDKNSYAVILEPVKPTRWNISETKEELTVVPTMRIGLRKRLKRLKTPNNLNVIPL